MLEGMVQEGLEPNEYSLIMALQATNYKNRGLHKTNNVGGHANRGCHATWAPASRQSSYSADTGSGGPAAGSAPDSAQTTAAAIAANGDWEGDVILATDDPEAMRVVATWPHGPLLPSSVVDLLLAVFEAALIKAPGLEAAEQ
eukprot:scaffold105790_cov21-Tisochrysis_lutea.AAC.1